MKNIFEKKVNLPRILIVSDSPVAWNQGTGACLIRQLRGYPPEKIRTVHTMPYDGSDYEYVSEALSLPKFYGERWVRRFARPMIYPLRCLRGRFRWRSRIGSILQEHRPEVILSIPFREESLALSRLAFKMASKDCRKIIHLYDWMPRHSAAQCQRQLSKLARVADYCWALGSNLADAASEWSGRPFETVPIFYDAMPEERHQPSKKDPKDIRCILIGNVWSPDSFYRVAEAWQRLRGDYPELAPIQWFASEWTMKRGWGKALEEDERLRKSVQYAGHLSPEALKQKLIVSDLAIIPFSVPESDASDYARYSIPSRVTELTMVGVPQFAVTGSQTGLGRYFSESGYGRFSNDSVESVYQALAKLLTDDALRKSESDASIAYGRRYFDLDRFQASFSRVVCEGAEFCLDPPAA